MTISAQKIEWLIAVARARRSMSAHEEAREHARPTQYTLIQNQTFCSRIIILGEKN